MLVTTISRMTSPLGPTADVLYRLKRGLSGYVSYLAACEMNEAFTEYVLYEPALRILTAQGFTVRCEVPCPGYALQGRGDVKRLDFVARKQGAHFALEIKWARNRPPRIALDVEKLGNYRSANPDASAILCIFGAKSALQNLNIATPDLRERGEAVYAEFGVTRFGCRVFELAASDLALRPTAD